MDIFQHESQYKVHLCEHTDEQPYVCLQEVLKHELGARQINEWWGVGGSQEISLFRILIKEEIITVQSETYMGIDVLALSRLLITSWSASSAKCWMARRFKRQSEMAQPREGERHAEVKDIQLQCRIYGYCPVQAEGTVEGKQFYFHARWDAWSFSVADSENVDPVDIQLPEQGFLREGQYGGPNQDEASWMPYGDAEIIIRRCAQEYVTSKEV